MTSDRRAPGHRPHGDDLRLGVCAIARNEAPYLLEWVAHQRLAGFHGVHVYDNESDDGTTEMLAALAAAGVLHTTPWPRVPDVPPQRHAYQHFVQHDAGRYDWVLVCDLDEFVVPSSGTVADFVRAGLERDPSVTAYALPWLVFGSGGQDEQRPGLVTERFTRCTERPGPSVKTLVRTDAVFKMRTHIADLLWGRYADNTHGEPVWSDRLMIDLVDPVEGELLVHHYFTKSREEWTRRRALPRADRAGVSHRNQRTFERYASLTRVEERAAARAPQLRAEIAYLQELVERHSGVSRAPAPTPARARVPRLGGLAGRIGASGVLGRRRRPGSPAPVVHSVSGDGVVGSVPGLAPDGPREVRLVLDGGVEEIVSCDRLVDRHPGFHLATRWRHPTPKRVRANVVGSPVVVEAVRDSSRDPLEVLQTVRRVMPGAEDKVFHLSLTLARSPEGLDRLAGLPPARFNKYPWYGDLLDGLVGLHGGEAGAADRLAASLARHPDGWRSIVTTLREKDDVALLEFLEAHELPVVEVTSSGPSVRRGA